MKRIDNILKYFTYEHLPDRMKSVSNPCCDLADEIYEYAESDIDGVDYDELYEGMRKLLEAKDCFVRALVK